MPDNFMQQQTRLRQRRDQQNLDIKKGSPFLGIVAGQHEPDSENVVVSHPFGERKMQTIHPYVGSDSWIRAGTESGQPVILAQRPDSNEPEILTYAQRDTQDRISAFANGLGMYRPISPGELDLHSRGAAETYYSRRPLLEDRAGMIRRWLDQDELQSGAKAPIHVRNLHLHKHDSIGDEERFGVVQRPDNSTFLTKYISADRMPDPGLTASVVESAASNAIIVESGPFAKEHLRILKTGALYPEKLLDVREGDVMDDEGSPVNLSISGEPLRYKGEWFTDNELGGVFFVGIDNQGNFAVAAPDEAEVGGDLKIPMGDLVITVGGGNETVTIQTDYSRTTVDGQMTIDCKTDYTKDIREGNKTETIHKGNVEQTVTEGTYTQTVESDHTTTVNTGNMTLTVDTGDRELTVAGDQTHTVTGDITIESEAAVHIIVGGTEVHIEDGLIELGAEGAGDIAVLDSLIQDELGAISDAIGQLKDEINDHKHPLPKYLIPLVPINEGPTVAQEDPTSSDEGDIPLLDYWSEASYDPGDTASGLVTIDS